MVTIDTIKAAAKRISNDVIRTPLLFSPTLSNMFNTEIYLKFENLQKTGSFKIRGATNKISQIRKGEHKKGTVAASAGNHAQGVALASRLSGIRSTIVMPEWASISKQEATANYGGEVIIHGQNLDESLTKARELEKEGMLLIHPFDDPDIISGQGTIGLEILEDQPDIDTIIVPIGGGGLICGIATAVKSMKKSVEIIGVQAKACPSAYQSLKQGKRVNVPAASSIADGIAVKQPGKLNFELIRQYVDKIVLVDETEIARAILLMMERKKTVAEGAGATPLAALLNGSVPTQSNRKIALVISGGNVDSPLLDRIIRQGLVDAGRITRLVAHINDIPGSLAELLIRIAALRANVLRVSHERFSKDSLIYEANVDLELETRGKKHIEEIYQTLVKAGYHIEIKQ